MVRSLPTLRIVRAVRAEGWRFPGHSPVAALMRLCTMARSQIKGHGSFASPQRRQWESKNRMWSAKGLSMEKWLCWGSMGVSGVLLLLFLLDLATAIPFGRLSLVVDIIGMV